MQPYAEGMEAPGNRAGAQSVTDLIAAESEVPAISAKGRKITWSVFLLQVGKVVNRHGVQPAHVTDGINRGPGLGTDSGSGSAIPQASRALPEKTEEQ